MKYAAGFAIVGISASLLAVVVTKSPLQRNTIS